MVWRVSVPTNQQRREAAKRKLERQLTRRAERARRRKIVGVVITVVAVIAAVGLVYWLANIGGSDNPAAATNTSTPPAAKTSDGPCKYTDTSATEPAAKDPGGMPPDPADTPKTGTVKVGLKTDQGDIPLVLDRAKAPCTVQAIEFLTKAKYFDATKCHRLTTTEGLKVLQCGDPTGAGNGGPGFTLPDEKPTDLKAGQAGPDGTPTAIYPRGVLAMANTGAPNSGGSQFFMVFGDSTLPPNYTVFGTIDAAGLTVLDKVAAGGVEGGSTDGAPHIPVTIQTATVAG
jgi:peptidyl-prolyl cis-trans isomerase B (cyclophilin B)